MASVGVWSFYPLRRTYSANAMYYVSYFNEHLIHLVATTFVTHENFTLLQENRLFPRAPTSKTHSVDCAYDAITNT